MKEVKGFDKCSSANDVFIWNEDDSQYGIDVPAWKQIVHEVDCSDEDCAKHCKEKFGGAFVNGVNKHVCYSYETLDSICIIIKYDKLRDEYVYHGGCFPGNQTYKMNPAALGEENKFNAVKIEVRDLSDPIVQAGEPDSLSFCCNPVTTCPAPPCRIRADPSPDRPHRLGTPHRRRPCGRGDTLDEFLIAYGAYLRFSPIRWDLKTTMTTFKNNIILRAHLEHSELW